MSDIESRLGYQFNNKNLLLLALTHSSYNSRKCSNNERLEFLGDKILGFLIAEILYNSFNDKDEGFLSKFLSYLTSKEVLTEIAEKMQLCHFLKKQYCSDNCLGADAVESIIAALYLDSKSFSEVRKFIEYHWTYYIEKYIDEDCYVSFNPKSFIQEWAQKNKLPIPEYFDIQREGSAHQPIFHVEISVEGYERVVGIGNSKKQAQKDASMKFIEQHKINKDI